MLFTVNPSSPLTKPWIPFNLFQLRDLCLPYEDDCDEDEEDEDDSARHRKRPHYNNNNNISNQQHPV